MKVVYERTYEDGRRVRVINPGTEKELEEVLYRYLHYLYFNAK